MLRNTTIKYGSVTKWFHWGMAILIIALLIIGLVMTDMDNSLLKGQFYGLHKATGFLVFFLAIARLIWRWINPVPKLDRGIPFIIKLIATNNIRLLYVMIILYPLSGIMMTLFGGHTLNFYGLFEIFPFEKNIALAQQAHFFHTAVFLYLLIASLTAHVMGAIYHHFIRRDNTLQRML